VAVMVLAALLALSGAAAASAVPAYPGLVELEQPDGKKFQARQWGDERLHGWETPDGYTIVKDQQTGYWCYARKDGGGNLVSTGVRADGPPPAGLPEHLRPEEAAGQQARPAVREVTLVGVAVPSEVEGPHYELLVPDRVCNTISGCVLSCRRYVLSGAGFRVGWLYFVRGHLSDKPNIWMRPAVGVRWAIPLVPVSWLLELASAR